jgi:hypothetical protein
MPTGTTPKSEFSLRRTNLRWFLSRRADGKVALGT